MPIRLFQPVILEFPNGAVFRVESLDKMEARPTDTLEHAPKTFVWTGFRKVSLSMPIADFDAAYKVIERNGTQPCVLVRGDDRQALAFGATSLSTTQYSTAEPREMIRGEMDGVLYEKAMDGQPVTDDATIAYLIEQYKPREYTDAEIAEMKRENALYDESGGW